MASFEMKETYSKKNFIVNTDGNTTWDVEDGASLLPTDKSQNKKTVGQSKTSFKGEGTCPHT